MIQTKSPISIKSLFELRTKLSSVVEKIEDQFQRDFFQALIDTLLLELSPSYEDIQEKGIYKALVLGTSDLSIINDFVGVNTSALASNENYLISIRRTYRDQFLKIDFVENSDLSEDFKRILVGIFRKKNPETNIERFLKNYPQKPLPSLILKDFDLSLLQSFDDDIRLLKSTKLIKRIILELHFSSTTSDSSNVFSLCRFVDVVPSGYDLNRLKISDLTNDPNEFKLYNFIILNSKDDFLIQTFFDLFLHYEAKLEIQGEFSRKVLESIFYVTDKDTLTQTRVLQAEDPKHEKYKKAVKGLALKSSVDHRHTYSALLLVLTYLEYYFLQNSEVPTKLYARASNQVNQNINHLFNKLKTVTKKHETLEEPKSNQMEVSGNLEKMEVGSLWHTVFNSRATQDILFELSKLLSYEILLIMAEDIL